MSQENVEVVRSSYKAFNRGDIDGVVANFAPDFEYVASGVIPGVGGVYRGAEGFREFVEGFSSEFSDFRAEIHELTEVGDQVLVSVTARGRGKQSGAEASWHVWFLWTLREGKIVRGQGIPSRDEALEAAGLSE